MPPLCILSAKNLYAIRAGYVIIADKPVSAPVFPGTDRKHISLARAAAISGGTLPVPEREATMKLGFGEILVILVVIMLVIGPDKLPEFAKKIGKALGEFRHATEDVSAELKENVLDPLDEAAAPIREAIEPIEEIKSSVNSNVRDMQRNLGSIGRVSTRKKAEEPKPEPEIPDPEKAAANAVEPLAPEAVPAAEPAPETEEITAAEETAVTAAAEAAETVTEAPAPETKEETAPETVPTEQ